jgi:hypothetical protein
LSVVRGDGSFDKLSSRFAGKQGDRVDSGTKDHHCGDAAKATGVPRVQKVTRALKSEATEPPQKQKITTAGKGAKRPGCLKDKSSRMH